MARLRDRLEVLEEGRRARAADALRRLLRTVSDEEVARWVVDFRRGAPIEESAPEPLLEVEGLFDEALGSDWTTVPQHELDRRCALVVDELLEMRRDVINAKIREIETKGENE